jgi:hypothetical protein
MTEPESAVIGGGGIIEPESAVIGGGGMTEPESAVIGGGGITEPESAVRGDGGMSEPDRAVLGGRGMTEPDRAVLGGGGMTEPDSAVIGGGGITELVPYSIRLMLRLFRPLRNCRERYTLNIFASPNEAAELPWAGLVKPDVHLPPGRTRPRARPPVRSVPFLPTGST